MTQIQLYIRSNCSVLSKLSGGDYFKSMGDLYRLVSSYKDESVCISIKDLTIVNINPTLSVEKVSPKEIEISVKL